MFEHQDLGELWSDYSTVTSTEKSMTFAETILLNFKNNIKIHQKLPFEYDGNTYIARFYPLNYTKKTKNFDEFNIYLSYPDTVRYIFHITSPFVVITSKTDRITERKAHSMLSALAPAMELTRFRFPVLINIPLKVFIKYIGASFSSNASIHYYSNSLWNEIELVDSYPKALNFFKEAFYDPKFIDFSGRQHMEINYTHYADSVRYRYDCFYSNVADDPIQTIKIFFQWNKILTTSFQPRPSNASHLRITINSKNQYSHRTPMHSFIKRKISLDGNDSFQIWTTDHPSSQIRNAISNIMSSDKKWNANSNNKGYFKSSPENSILETFSINVANLKTLANFASLWTEFLKKIRENVEKKIVIPNVSTEGVNYSYCLIYQHFQIINAIITNNSYVLAEDNFNEMKEMYAQSSNNSILEKLVLSFKNQKSVPFSYEEFSKEVKIDEETWNSIHSKINRENYMVSDTLEILEICLDYLESLKPSEVYSQIILSMLDAAFRDITKRAIIEIPLSRDAYNTIKKSFEEFSDKWKNADSLSPADLIPLCRIIEENTLKIDLVNSALSKIPSFQFVLQLFDKGFCSLDTSKDIESISSIVEAMNLDGLFNHIKGREFIFTGKSTKNDEESLQYLFVSKRKDDSIEKYIIATAFQECT